MNPSSLSRRSFAAAFMGLLIGPGIGRAQSRKMLRLSYQRSSSLLLLLQQTRRLEAVLAPLGYDLEWSLLSQEIMRVGGVDLHGDIAESVPLFVHPANPTNPQPITRLNRLRSASTRARQL